MLRIFIVPMIIGVLMMGTVIACQKEEGPAEKAGKKIDKAIEEAGEKIEEAGDKVREATEK
jgi:hypothetical protein